MSSQILPRAEASWWASGVGLWRLGEEEDGGDEEGGAYEAGGVENVTALVAEVGDHERGDRWADDAHSEHDLLHEGVGGAEAVKGNGGADGDPCAGEKKLETTRWRRGWRSSARSGWRR